MKVLFIRFSAIGDIVLATGPIDYFHEKFPEAQIDVLTSPVGREILCNIPYIKNFHTAPKGSSLLTLISIYRQISDYDYIFDLQGTPKSYLSSFFIKGQYKKVLKHSRERRAFVKNRKFKSKLTDHVVQKYAKVFTNDLHIDNPSLERLRPILPKLKQSNDFDLPKNYVVFHPYASQKNKEWPFFSELSEKLIQDNINIVVIGSGESLWPKEVINLSNKTSLEQLQTIIQNSSALITTDSGPMHIGVALQKLTISIFGPTTKELGFYPNFKNSITIEDNNLDCRPCHIHGGNSCPLSHFNCMNNISTKNVYRQLTHSLS